MFLDPTPLTIALAIILSTSPYVLAAPHRRHHNTILDRAGEIEYYEQRHAHEPMHVATPPIQTPPVTVQSVKTITVIPTPVRTPMPSSMKFQRPPDLPLPNGTRKPVDTTSSTTTTSSSSLTTSKTEASSTPKSTSASSVEATEASAAPTTSASVIVVALPSSTLTLTVPDATTITIPSIATPTLSSIATIEDIAASEILSVLGINIDQLIDTATTATTTDATESDSDDTETTDTDSDEESATSTTATSTCLTGTTRKCCSAVHNNLKNVLGVLDDITGFDLDFLALDTSVGLDCADIDDDDTAEDGAVCWDVVSCCENNAISSLDSVFVGCVPVF